MTQPRGSDFTDLRQAEQTLQGSKGMVEVQRSHLDKPVLFHKHSSQNTEARCSMAKLEHLVGTTVPNSSATGGPHALLGPPDPSSQY